ncbi:MAG: hypothetical protein SCH70_07800 [Candidatus Methanoperedens sp.]|nr:hypothetical protein [Candidatus Methanoperedens sp.]
MVETTKGKNIVVETYDAEYKEFTGDGSETAFVMTDAIAESDVKYTRAYVETEEVVITSITTGTKTVTLAAAPADGARVEIYTPSTKNAAFTVQQDVRFSIDTRTEDIKELGNDAVTRDVVEKTGTLELALVQAKNHTAINKLALNSKNDTWMVIAVKYKHTSPVSYRIFKEARVNEIGGGISAGAVATERVTFNWKPPLEIKTT